MGFWETLFTVSVINHGSFLQCRSLTIMPFYHVNHFLFFTVSMGMTFCYLGIFSRVFRVILYIAYSPKGYYIYEKDIIIFSKWAGMIENKPDHSTVAVFPAPQLLPIFPD